MNSISRRQFLQQTGLITAAMMAAASVVPWWAVRAEGTTPFSLPTLPYAYDALEPYIDKQTMEVHHGKHHAAYVNNLNMALEKYPELQGKPVEDLIINLNALPEAVRTVVRNNGGGHANHSLFWGLMTPSSGEPSAELAAALASAFNSMETFKEGFAKSATGRFGSGWSWLVLDKDGTLKITSTANQDSPVSEGQTPLLGLDVWEHAYYLKYQNRRADYVAAWWNVVNWGEVGARFAAAKK